MDPSVKPVYQTVRVFISSTFHDMHAERDYLVRFVFPKLREELLQRRIHFADVDLRWGVTNDQDALEVCREIVDECRPRFLCMLGERYGWVPTGKTRSITADEVHYGVLDRDPREHGHAFFYFRDPAATASMVESYPGQFSEPHGSVRRKALENLKSAVVNAGLEPFIYPARWDNDEKRLIGLKAFGDRVYADLKGSIELEFGEQSKQELDEFQKEKAAMEAFIEDHAQGFVLGSRKPVLDELVGHAFGNSVSGCLCLVGEVGSGKSTLLARLARILQEKAACFHPQTFLLISHFVGASIGSADVRNTLRRLCHDLIIGTGRTTEVPGDPEELRSLFHEILKQADARKQVVILLDAINLFDPGSLSTGLWWLPEEVPDNVRFIVSTPPGPVLEDLRRHRCPPREVEMTSLTLLDGRAIVNEFLHRYRKSMTDEQRDALLAKTGACTPLYLLAALEELRTLGTYEEISDRIAQLPSETRSLFAWILKRLEEDDGFRDVSGRKIGHELVPRFASLMGTSRHGLSQRELGELLDPGAPHVKLAVSDDALGNVAALVQLLRPYLMKRGELLHFYHGQFREVVEMVYLQSAKERRDGHDRLAGYFRRKANPKGSHNWELSPRHLAELPFHLAHASQDSELQELLSQLSYLAARVATGQVYELVADYSLAGAPLVAALGEWRDFLQKHAQRLSQQPLMLVALANHEGFAEARKQAAAVNWKQPWLRTSVEPMPERKAEIAKDLRAEVIGSVDFPRGRAVGISCEPAIVFYLERLGMLRLIDLQAMQRTRGVFSIRRERPLVLACAPDASGLAVFYETGEAELYRCVFGRDGRPTRLELAAQFPFHLPEYEDPIVVWHGGACWYQSRADALGCVSMESTRVSEDRLPRGRKGELSALVLGQKTRLVVLRHGRDTLLLSDDAPEVRRRKAVVHAACACGRDKVAVAFSDGFIVVYETNGFPKPVGEVCAGILRGTLGWDGSRLLWLAEKGEFCAWHPGDSGTSPAQDDQEIFPANLHVIPRQWLRAADSSMTVVTTHSVVTFKLCEGGKATEGRLESFSGGPVWRAVFKRNKDQWLMESLPLREVLLGRDVMSRLYCAADGRGHFFAISGSEKGLVFELTTLRSRPVRGCPPGLNIAIGEPAGGCWLIDRAGDIYFADAGGDCRCAERIGLPDVHGAQLRNCGDFLLWSGFSTKFFPETGAESARTFVFFSKRRGIQPKLERLGEQSRHPREGLCLAICYDESAKQLVTLWEAPEKGLARYNLRVGGVQEFLAWRFAERQVTGLGSGMFAQADLSADAKLLGIVNIAGEFSCLNVTDGRIVATLAGSVPFTAVAPGPSGTQFWLVAGRSQVYRCSLTRMS